MKNLFSIILIFFCLSSTYAQIGVKADGSAPIPSAQLEVQSTNKAFYPPRMTTSQRTTLPSPPQKGAMVFDTDLNGLYTFNGTSWVLGSGFTLPYTASQSVGNANLLKLENTDVNAIYPTIQGSTNSNYVSGIIGYANNTTPTGNTVGVDGVNYSTNGNGYGVYGSHSGTGSAVYGYSASGTGIRGLTNTGIGGSFSSANGYALITGAGNVGIGKSTPTEKLNISGNVLTEGSAGGFRFGDRANNLKSFQWYATGGNAYLYRHHNTANNVMSILENGNVGIGLNTPLEQIHIDGGVLATNATTVTTNPGILPLPVSGAGTRMMWIPTKGAFRVGTVLGSSWDSSNMGTWSFASGYETIASGEYSMAMGYNTKATGDNTTVMGYYSKAMGARSTAMGFYSDAIGNYSTAIGYSTTANGDYSTALGSQTTTNGLHSIAMGNGTNANGDYSTATGYYSTAQSYTSVVIGRYNTVSGNSTAWVSTDPLFVIGNGSTITNRNNALTVLKNGNVVVDGNVFAPNFVVSSDKRFKKNIKAIENPLANILNIEGVRYDWRRDEFPERHFSEKNQIGFIAQEIEKIFPEMVFTDEKGFKSVDYARITPVLVEAIKELTLKNQKLESRLEKIEEILSVSVSKK